MEAFMGKGKAFKLPKFTSALKLAIVRAGVLKNQRQSRSELARNDVVQLLQQNLFERAVVRVEQVIKEQNMADVFTMIDSYCHFLLERAYLVEQERECPEELQEAAASLIHASTRCGEFPELQEIRAIFTSKYGREFTARAVELRNSCGVNSTMIQKLSTRQIEYDKRASTVNEIAAGITTKNGNIESRKERGWEHKIPNEEYENVADAAQAAFESAAHAAAAARAAVELSRFDRKKSFSKDHTGKISHEEKDGDATRVSLDGDVGSVGFEDFVISKEDDNGRQKGELSSEIYEDDDGIIDYANSQDFGDKVDLNINKKDRPRNVFSRLFGRKRGPVSSKPSHIRGY